MADHAPLALTRLKSAGHDGPQRYRGEVATVEVGSPSRVTRYEWEADSPSDIVAWWLQGMPEGGPVLLGKADPEDDEEREPFTPEERLLIRTMLREKQTEISALIMKLDGGE